MHHMQHVGIGKAYLASHAIRLKRIMKVDYQSMYLMLCVTLQCRRCCRGHKEAAQFVVAARGFNAGILNLLEPIIGYHAAQDFMLRPKESWPWPSPAAATCHGAPVTMIEKSALAHYDRIEKTLRKSIVQDYGCR